MEYRIFGKTGKKISLLGFGAGRLPADDEYAVEVIRRGLDLGINYIDSGFGYREGTGEVMVGRAVKGREETVYLSTKNPSLGDPNFSLKLWWERLETTLKRFDVDHIHFYGMIHDMRIKAYHTFMSMGGMEGVQKAKEKGMIGHLCFSSHDTPENIKKFIDSGYFDGMIVVYNLLDRSNEEVIKYAYDKGMGVVIMQPVGGGALGAPSEMIQRMIPGKVKATAEMALRFVFSNPYITTAISGMSELSHVEENVALVSQPQFLGEDEKVKIKEILDEQQKLVELFCTACRYCMPCPEEVGISEIFTLMNYYRIYGLGDYATTKYALLEIEGRGKNATACIECGQCEEKCPRKIPIMEQLKESHKALSKR